MKLLKIVWVVLMFPLCAAGQDVYEIKFNADATQYRAALVVFADGSGQMRTKFNDEGTQVVEQSVKIDSTRFGVKLKGSNPVYPGTSIEFPSYDIDTFYVSENEYGNYSDKNVKNDETINPTIRKVEGDREIEHFLFFFNWKLGPG